MLQNETIRYSLYLLLGAALFYIPFNGGVHLFDWDEVNFAEISREMILLGEYSRVYVNFEPFYQKPPLYFWLQALSMHLFGVGEFAARFPNACCGLLTLPLLYLVGRRLFSHQLGLLWAGLFGTSVLPFLYFKSGIIDPWFNLFIFLGLLFVILAAWKKDQITAISLRYNTLGYLLLGGFFVGMGILTKGHVAYLVVVLTMGVYWLFRRFRMYISVGGFLIFSAAACVIMLSWFGWETLVNGPDFIVEFLKYQYKLFSTPDAGHKGFPGYHFVVLLVGCFPASIFLIRAFFKQPKEEHAFQQDFRLWMKILFWVVLVLFSIVQSKIVHYSSLCYFPLTFLAASVIDKILNRQINYSNAITGGLFGIGALYLVAIVTLPILGQNPEQLTPLFDDPFAKGNLEAEVRWTGLEVIPAILLLGLLIAYEWLRRKSQFQNGLWVLLGGMPFFLMLTLYFFIGRIEGYSQRAAVEFFEGLQGKAVSADTYGYKSYVPLFYGRPQSKGQYCFQNKDCQDQLLYGSLQQPAFIITKIHKAEPLNSIEGLEKIGEKNGFVFYRRIPVEKE